MGSPASAGALLAALLMEAGPLPGLPQPPQPPPVAAAVAQSEAHTDRELPASAAPEAEARLVIAPGPVALPPARTAAEPLAAAVAATTVPVVVAAIDPPITSLMAAAAPLPPVIAAAVPAAPVAPGPAAPAVGARLEPPAAPAIVPLGSDRIWTRANPALAGFPEIVLPPGPEAQRLAVALLALPLLLAICLWALVRLASAVRVSRRAAARAAIAHQLGVPAEQLAALDPEGLRRLRDGIAFDELTGVLRRAAGLAALDRELARVGRSGQPLSVAFVDVDGLKEANDGLGHSHGDALLRGVAGVLTHRLRAQDLVFRYGGDEFICVMPATPRPRAEAILEEMRQRAGATGLRFSFGVAQAGGGEAAETVIERADSLQYLDKQARRVLR